MPPLRTFLSVAAAVLLVTAAHAQSPVTLEGGDASVSVLADQFESTGPDLIIATGNVEITRGAARLTADRVEINRSTGDAVASGRVIFFDGQDRLSSSRIDYNIKTGTGVAHDADALSLPYYRLAGEKIERLGDSVYQIRKGIFTTCQDDPPAWSFHASSAKADLNDYLVGQGGSFWVKNVPIFPLPVFAVPIRRERQTGFLPPTFGYSNKKGFEARVPFFWAINDSQDLTVALDAYSKRGLGLTAEYRYILSARTQGLLGGFFIREFLDGNDDTRGYGRLRHNWAIDPTLTLRADVNYVSDDALLRDYGDLLATRTLQFVDSNVFLTQRWRTWNFVADAFWYQDLTTEQPIELQRLPTLELYGFLQPVPRVPGLLWSFQSSATNFVRDLGSSGARVDLQPRLSRPFSPGGLFTFTPFVGARATIYNREVVGTSVLRPQNVVVEDTRDTVRTRLLGEVGATLKARATRVYDVNTGWIDKFLHSIEPELQYAYVDGTNTDRNPQWDQVDGVDQVQFRNAGLFEPVGRTNVLFYSLTNRLLARTPADVDGNAFKWEALRLGLSGTIDADASQRPVRPIVGELILDPGRYLRFRADAAFDVYNRDTLRAVNTDVALTLADLTAAIGSRYDTVTNVNFLQAEATARVTTNLLLRGVVQWDIQQNALVEGRIGADLRFQCWAFAVTYVNRYRGEDEIRFSIDLLGIGSATTGTGLGLL